MNTIEVVCPSCRNAAKIAAATLLVDVNEPQTGSGCHASLYWMCEACEDLVAVALGWAAWLAVINAGATIVDGDAQAARPQCPERAVGGPALTVDDLLDLHEALAEDYWDVAELDTGPLSEPRPGQQRTGRRQRHGPLS